MSLEKLVRITPLIRAPAVGADVYLKLECLQRTGSFKLRGAVRACAALSEQQRARGVVVASAGNHGAGMALATSAIGVSLTVVVPRGTPETKQAKIRGAGGIIDVYDGDYDAAEAYAKKLAAKNGAVFVSAFDDEHVISGNGGWLAEEIREQLPELTRVVVPVGGGGMIAGLSRTLAPAGVEVFAAQPRSNCALHDSLAAGRALTDYVGKKTVAEGCEGAVGELAFSIARPHIAGALLASEQQIEEAVAFAYRELGIVSECSGAVGLAVLRAGQLEGDGVTVCVISGGNIDDDELDRITSTGLT